MNRRIALLLMSLLPPLLLGCATEDEMKEQFAVEGLPLINEVVPSAAFPGQVINLHGVNFGADKGQLYLGEGTGAVVPMVVEQWGDTFIIARVPQTTFVNLDVPIALITTDNRKLPLPVNVRVVAPPTAQN